jgi:hypothetical protein
MGTPGHTPGTAPTLSGGALICVTVGSCHRAFHWLLSDGADHLLQQAGAWSAGCGFLGSRPSGGGWLAGGVHQDCSRHASPRLPRCSASSLGVLPS